MFFKILRKDLKRKKSMNLLLFLFIVLTAMLLGTSITMLTTVSSATNKFVKDAKMADFIAVTYTDKDSDEIIKKWLTDNPIVKEYFMQKDIILTSDMLTLPKKCEKFKYDNMLGLEAIPTETNLIFDESDHPLSLKEGEIAIPYLMKDKTKLSIGDTMTVNAYGVTKEFKVVHYTKDAFTGSSLLGFKRIVVNEKDYQTFNIESASKINNVCVNMAQGHKTVELERQFSKLAVNSLTTMNRSMYGMLYMMEMMVAAIMAIVSVFLILIAFIILRFTIVFTIQEDYKQIGIMKAIGLKDRTVRGIYMVKYFMLSLIGGVIGYIISIPLGKKLINISCEAMVVESNSYFNLISLLAVAVIIALTILFCRRCTGKISKVSAIEAIRNGGSGERFTKLSKVSLHSKKRMGVSTFLSLSDISNNFKRYGVLLVTFILGTMILLIPINIINTLKDTSALRLFGQAEIDVLVNPKNATEILYTYSMDDLKKIVNEAQKEYKEADIPVDLYLDVTYMSKVYGDDPDNSKTIYTNISYGIDSSEYNMQEGVAPELENEVAITKQVAKYFNVGVGDKLHIYVSNQEKEFVVTGLYESMINMGTSIRIGSKLDLPMDGCTGFNIFGRYTKAGDEEAYRTQMTNADSRFEVKDGIEYVNDMLGSVVSILEALRFAILVVILVINFIITMLITRMMLAKETAEVAILKSIGFKDRTIRSWQIKRMVYILLISVIAGTILVGIFGADIALIVFKMIGVSKLSLVIKPVEVFLLYPACIVIDITAAVLLSTIDIKKIKVWEVNNQE